MVFEFWFIVFTLWDLFHSFCPRCWTLQDIYSFLLRLCLWSCFYYKHKRFFTKNLDKILGQLEFNVNYSVCKKEFGVLWIVYWMSCSTPDNYNSISFLVLYEINLLEIWHSMLLWFGFSIWYELISVMLWHFIPSSISSTHERLGQINRNAKS